MGITAADRIHLRDAIEQARESARQGGFPAGAVIVKGGKVVGRGISIGSKNNDPTSHGETDSIRKACRYLKTADLGGATLYASLQPCIMCFSAACWAGVSRVVYACRKEKVSQDYYLGSTVASDVNSKNRKKIELVHVPELEEESLKAVREWEKGPRL
jgi:guanine deaminase